MVMGFCIGGPMIHNLIRRAPERVVAAAMMQPSGFRPEIPDLFYQNNIKLGASLVTISSLGLLRLGTDDFRRRVQAAL